MKYLLDTNVVSELRRPKPHGAVLAWLSQLPDDAIGLSAVILGELQAGVEKLRLRNREKADQIESWGRPRGGGRQRRFSNRENVSDLGQADAG